MATLTLTYRSGVTNYSQSFEMRSIRGYAEPDEVQLVGGPQILAADHSLQDQIVGFRRVITGVFGVQQTAAERAFLFNWTLSPNRWANLAPYSSAILMLEDPVRFVNQWKNGSQLGRTYTIRLLENTIYTEWPSYVDPTETETLYITSHVQITGTPDSPQPLVTNTGPLATDDTGNAFPAINLSAYAVSVLVEPEQECECYYVGETLAQNGANIEFQVAHSYAGNAYADGNYYAVITLGLQAK